MSRRRGLARRHAALLVTGSGLALAGLVVLVVVWVGLVTATLRAGLADQGTCVAAATADEGDAALGSTLVPPRAVCTRTVDGAVDRTVLAEGPVVLTAVAAGAAAVGVLLVAVGAGAAWRARRGPRPPR